MNNNMYDLDISEQRRLRSYRLNIYETVAPINDLTTFTAVKDMHGNAGAFKEQSISISALQRQANVCDVFYDADHAGNTAMTHTSMVVMNDIYTG